jgi:hypothetical protein
LWANATSVVEFVLAAEGCDDVNVAVDVVDVDDDCVIVVVFIGSVVGADDRRVADGDNEDADDDNEETASVGLAENTVDDVAVDVDGVVGNVRNVVVVVVVVVRAVDNVAQDNEERFAKVLLSIIDAMQPV